MKFLEPLRGGLRRVDVRVARNLALLFAPLVAGLLFALYVFAADELLELATLELDHRLSILEQVWSDPEPGRRTAELSLLGAELDRDLGGFRVVDARGAVQLIGGRVRSVSAAATTGATAPTVATPVAIADRLLGSIRLGNDDVLETSRTLASGERLELFVSSAAFVRERNEILAGFWWTLAFGVGLVALAAIPATWLSLAPLRRATAVTSSLDARSLAARLPIRGTQDDVDRHARAVNALLDQIELGFARLQAFSQDVAHELRTPVHRILNATELRLLDRAVDGASRRDFEAIHRSADQMVRLIDSLLLLARGEGDPLALRKEEIDVASLFGTLEEMYAPVCEEASIRLVVECPSLTVSGDQALLLRALGNLIDNALAHTPAGGTIALRAEREANEPRWVRLEVADSGPGIPVEARERIFDRFVRLTGVRRTEGVGLGLPITRAIVRAHGGEIGLEESGPSTARSPIPGPIPMVGACFVVRLPRGEG